MGQGLTLRSFSETRLAFLRDTLESVGDSEARIAQRLRIAAVLIDLARWKESEEQQRHALAEATALANAKLVARTSNDLAQLLQHTNRFGEAEPLMRRALEIDEAVFGEQHSTVAIRMNNLATLLLDTNRSAEAEPMMRRALEIDEIAFGEQHPTVAVRLSNLAILLKNPNRMMESEPLMRRSLEILDSFRRQTGHEHPHFQHANKSYQALQRAMESDEPI